ncbi:GmrSD restriction endonuclease domain-containing protein [Nocardioides sp. URHA0020]|uniref:GmrSD restriction endonuclease domain-containing protein n=1 Tax=Nocardioides sp. URHA0020 TaxID=1380392 RepID=UPI0009DEFFDF|nr:DUF262 domain-containing protein [Nocardioides sp. URHA0020]
METNVRTPQEVFYLPQHLLVPLFQRPYVWNEVDQWQPLWQDVTRMAELRLANPSSTARHFLGAVVLQASDPVAGSVQTWNLIDGQQRVTTLQLMTDAVALVCEERGLDHLGQQLGDLTHNRAHFGSDGRTRKLMHANRDGDSFAEVMDAEPPVDHGSLRHAGALITRAHEFFVAAANEWIGFSESAVERRATVLATVIAQGLQLVVIDLRSDENSQEIFETLNARGTPLTAADLIKNFVFQKLGAEGGDVRKAYAEDWPFETKFWETEVSIGRYLLSRSSLFLSQWLGARLGEEIGPRQTFVRFKHHVDHEADVSMGELLILIKRQAAIYESWALAAADTTKALTPPEMAFYRMQATGVELLKPALIWLYDPSLNIASGVADEVIGMLESWTVRRQLLRLTSANLGRTVSEIIKNNRSMPSEMLSNRVRDLLTSQTAASNYWPGDEEIIEHLATEQAYNRYPRARLRTFLEAIEDHLRRSHLSQPIVRSGLPIEHILPQAWEANWPVEGLAASTERAERVHRLGNLTLLTTSLNSSVSNSSWETKRGHLDKHDVFLLNRGLRAIDDWNEAVIDRRTTELTIALLEVWPVPHGHDGKIADRAQKAESWVEVKHLVAAGLIEPGTVLSARSGPWGDATATVQADGSLEVDGEMFGSPSGAGNKVRGGDATNGWIFWRLSDGRPLGDIRATYRGEKPESKRARFDWSPMHAILETIPDGTWTSYAELASAVGTAPQPLGNHIVSCKQCTRPWRVLTWDGRVADNFTWSDPDDHRDPTQLLKADGVRVVGGKADPTQLLGSESLLALIAGEPAERA